MTKGGASRASSVHAESVARTLVRRRDKPYKTERSLVWGNKKKLHIRTSYDRAPKGFQFVRIGTLDLSERCKELSRQRDFPVHNVSATPRSSEAADPKKVSHYLHRIGYHFRAEIVDEACQELGYTFFDGSFMKEEDLMQQSEQSRLARALTRYGLLPFTSTQETDDQVRAAIRELFPNIPQEDVKEILGHAWEEGTRRVGNCTELSLARRAQLAVIARIRHKYTDYDHLLKTFDWRIARDMVQPYCVAKLMQWIGLDQNDDELEMFIRETIVIDDHDEHDDSDAVRSYTRDEEEGQISDSSVEVIQRPVGDANFGAESSDELSRQYLKRYQPLPRSTRQPHVEVRQTMREVREQLRSDVPIGHAQRPDAAKVHALESGEEFINIDGRLFQKEHTMDSPKVYHGIPPSETMRHHSSYGLPYGQSQQEVDSRVWRMPLREVQVIDHGPRRSSPDSERSGKRRRMDNPAPMMVLPRSNPDTVGSPDTTHSKEVDDFGRHLSLRNRPFPAIDKPCYYQPADEPRDLQQPLPPASHPSDVRHREQEHYPLIVDAQIAPIQFLPRSSHGSTVSRSTPSAVPFLQSPHHQSPYHQSPYHQSPHHQSPYNQSPYHQSPHHQSPQTIYVPAPHTSHSHTPQPVHGAPAAVQQVPRDAMHAMSLTPAAAVHATPLAAPGLQHLSPAGYATPPQQYYAPPPQQYYAIPPRQYYAPD